MYRILGFAFFWAKELKLNTPKNSKKRPLEKYFI
jgi:hypothetical protein